MLFDSLADIAAFDFFETRDFLNELLVLLPTNPINEKFESVGIEDLYFINNLGTLAIVIAVYLSLVLILLVLFMGTRCLPNCCLRQIRRLEPSVFWNGGISLVFESCLIVFIVGYIQLEINFLHDSLGEMVQIYTCIGILAVYIMMSTFVLAITLYKFD